MVDFDVVSLPDTDHPEAGEVAPDFTRPFVTSEYWENAALSSRVDPDGLVLVFHPMDGAFPTTYIWQAVVERGWARHAPVAGVSISDPYRHKALLRERGLLDGEYGLFSDPANGVAEDYGIVNELDGMAGVREPRPAVFVLDDERVVEYAWVASEWPDFPPYDEVTRTIAD